MLATDRTDGDAVPADGIVIYNLFMQSSTAAIHVRGDPMFL